MPQLDELVDEWVRGVEASEPALGPHLEEIADHVRSDARDRVQAGSDVPSAFAAAVGAFGAPRDLAHDYTASAYRSQRRAATTYAAVMIGGTLVLTGAVVAIDKLVHPLDPRWFTFLYLPILLASNLFFFERARST